MLPVELYAPEEYWALSDTEKNVLLSGCGPGRLGFLVPETVYGMSITDACNIHDYMYAVGQTIGDKEGADRVFLNNMIRLIDGRTGWRWLKALRRWRAMTYYTAVKDYGGPAFWKGKNKPSEMAVASTSRKKGLP